MKTPGHCVLCLTDKPDTLPAVGGRVCLDCERGIKRQRRDSKAVVAALSGDTSEEGRRAMEIRDAKLWR